MNHLMFCSEMAEGLGRAGHVADGLAEAERAIERCQRNEEGWIAAELLRIQGELLLWQGTSRDEAAATTVRQGRKADAVAAFQRAIQESLTAGQKPQEALYKRAVGVAYDAQLPVATDLGRQWASAYPGPDSWRNAIAIYRNMNHPDVEGTLDLLRLMQATGSLNSVPDYDLFVSAAADQSNFVEAQAIIDQGIAAKVIDPASPVFRDTIAALKTKPKATSADLAEATKTAVSGMALLRIGDRYFGLGDYAKAAELYRTSIGKTGVDPNIANLHLGMALARSGDKAGAITAFSAVTGTRADIAKFWLLYVQSRS